MQKHERDILALAENETKRAGVLLQIKKRAGRHPTKMVLTGAGCSITIPIASSPRDADHAIRNTAKQVIGAIKEITTAQKESR